MTARIFFGIGLQLGALAAVTAFGLLGGMIQDWVPSPARWTLALVALIAIAAREFGLVSYRIPENRRLVPETVTARGTDFGAMQFGFEMGTGMRTYSPSALPHLMALGAVLVIPFGWALVAAAGFAAGRWAMALASLGYDPDGTWSDVWARHKRGLAIALTVATALSLAAGLLG